MTTVGRDHSHAGLVPDRRSERAVVLVSEPQGPTSELQFDNVKPYVWAVLKSHHERHGEQPDGYQWLDPIWRNDLPETLLAPLDDQRIDVLGLSRYAWNWALNCEIARMVKERKPESLVVAGGARTGLPGRWLLRPSSVRRHGRHQRQRDRLLHDPKHLPGWGGGGETICWITWIKRTVVGRSSAAMNNLQQVELVMR